jgi:hypothetical protein
MSNTTNRIIRVEEMFMPCCSILRQELPKETQKETQERMSPFDCSKEIEEEQGERKEDVAIEPKKNEKEEEKGDECCICLEELPKDTTTFTRFSCCGQGMHDHCNEDLHSMNMGDNCPLCRALQPSTQEEVVKYLRPWVKKKKAWAQSQMGSNYYQGEGVKRSYEMAAALWKLAAQQGEVNAMYNVGQLYEQGQGVEQSFERAKQYYEKAAALGDAGAQFSLGLMYYQGNGVEKDLKKANELWTKSAILGHVGAIQALKHTDK